MKKLCVVFLFLSKRKGPSIIKNKRSLGTVTFILLELKYSIFILFILLESVIIMNLLIKIVFWWKLRLHMDDQKAEATRVKWESEVRMCRSRRQCLVYKQWGDSSQPTFTDQQLTVTAILGLLDCFSFSSVHMGSLHLWSFCAGYSIVRCFLAYCISHAL